MVTKNQNSQEGAVLGFWISVRPSILNQIGKVEKKRVWQLCGKNISVMLGTLRT